MDPVIHQRLFQPVRAAKGPSGLEQPPGPYVIRAAHLDGLRLMPGESFHFDVHLFDVTASGPQAIAALLLAARTLSEQGFGPSRDAIRLIEATRVDYPGKALEESPFCLSLNSLEAPCSRLEIQFVTPMELKHDGRAGVTAEFPILFSRARDRISNLTALYNQRPFFIDFVGLSERAAKVQVIRQSLQVVERSRRSSRTGQIHGVGGFTGKAEYDGQLAEFLPWLRVAEWTGVGRHTMWGNGQVRIIAQEE